MCCVCGWCLETAGVEELFCLLSDALAGPNAEGAAAALIWPQSAGEDELHTVGAEARNPGETSSQAKGPAV